MNILELAVLCSILVQATEERRIQTTTQSVLETSYVHGVLGHPALLPCDMTPPHPEELVYLVLWYRDDEGEPLYSYDSRQGAWNKGQRWSDKNQFGDRAYFYMSSDPAELRIQNIQTSDGGIYRCRVDFKSAPTRNSLVNLTVITPPSTPHLFNESGDELAEVAGPYLIGEVTSLKCIVAGGDPVPSVTWWKEGRLIDSSWEEGFSGDIHNTVQIGPLTRDDLGTMLTCQGSNNNISVPTSHRISIDMIFPPEMVKITNNRQPLSSRNMYTLRCETSRSRPHAVITWWLGERFQGKVDQINEDDTSLSVIQFQPSPELDGSILTCRAENTYMKEGLGVLEDSWRLSVHYPPIVHLKLGHNLDSQVLEEGSDVYLECQVQANPKHYKIVWLHDGKPLEQKVDEGLIISRLSLVMQRIGRERRGNYSCVVSNTEGDTQSNQVSLKIKYSPRCSHQKKISVGTSLGRSLKVLCEVDSFPKAQSFSWTFNNSKESINVRGQDRTLTNGSSILTYSAHSDRDFGHLYCWAGNEQGRMKEPCIFHIIPAGPPQPPTSCTVLNQTTDLLQVECLPGFDGGLDQTFLLEVIDVKLRKVLVNVSSATPHFTITGLNSGRDLELRIFGVNRNGPSAPNVLDGFRLKVAELQIDSESPVPVKFTPFLDILAGVLIILCVVIVIVIVVIRKYRTTGRDLSVPSQTDAEEYFPSPKQQGAKMASSSTAYDTRNPPFSPTSAQFQSQLMQKEAYTNPGNCQLQEKKTEEPGWGAARVDRQLDTMENLSTIHSQLVQRQLSSGGDGNSLSAAAKTNITVNPGDSCNSWTPLLHLNQESIL